MKRIIKILLLYVIILVVCGCITTSAASEPVDDHEYEKMSTEEKIGFSKCYASLNVNYILDADFTKGTTKYFYTRDRWGMNGVDIAEFTDLSNYLFNNTANEIEAKIIYNDVSEHKINLIKDDGIELKHAANGNGEELVIKFSNYVTIEKFAYTLASVDEGECVFTTNANNVSELQPDSCYYIEGICTELKIKNVDKSNDIHIKILFIDTAKYSYNVKSVEFKKDANNKSQCAMQFVGRIPKELYEEIRTTYGSENVTFGMLYGDVGSFDRSECNAAIEKLKCGNLDLGSCKAINEINYNDLCGYDETGYNIVKEDPTYYQWGVSISNILVAYVVPVIRACPYVKVKVSDNNYEVYSLNNSLQSVRSLCNEYYKNNIGSDLDKAMFKFIADIQSN